MNTMMNIRNRTIFLYALLAGLIGTLLFFGYFRLTAPPALAITALTSDVHVTTQIELSQIPKIKAQGFNTIVDMRPDGEAIGQAPAAEVKAAADRQGLHFAYLPIPHGDAVPDTAVGQLAKIIDHPSGPVLLYCRSGRRATRAWSLAEASRSSGLTSTEISVAAQRAGHSIADLQSAIDAAILHRPDITPSTP